MLMAVALGVFGVLPWLSPRRFELDPSSLAYLFVLLLTIGMLGYVHAAWLLYAVGRRFDVAKAVVGGVFVMLGLLGLLLPQIPRNFFIGVRTPWTLADARVWDETHRAAAWLLVLCGFAGAAMAIAGLPLTFPIVSLVIVATISVVYSLAVYKRLERDGAAHDPS